MKVFLECLPCIMRQALDASRMSAGDDALQSAIMKRAVKITGDFENRRNSPEIAGAIHKMVAEMTGVTDPYREIKRKDMDTAFSLLPILRKYVCEAKNASDGIHRALKVAAAGNSLDSAVYGGGVSPDLESLIEKELGKPFASFDGRLFESIIFARPANILIVADNAGETVFDAVLAEKLYGISSKIFYTVREKPILNDATIEEAVASGLSEYAEVISSGSTIPGTIVSDCNPAFRKIFNEADIVISKGQGNFETLSDEKRGIFYLLKTKCNVLANLLGTIVNDYVFVYKENGNEAKSLENRNEIKSLMN